MAGGPHPQVEESPDGIAEMLGGFVRRALGEDRAVTLARYVLHVEAARTPALRAFYAVGADEVDTWALDVVRRVRIPPPGARLRHPRQLRDRARAPPARPPGPRLRPGGPDPRRGRHPRMEHPMTETATIARPHPPRTATASSTPSSPCPPSSGRPRPCAAEWRVVDVAAHLAWAPVLGAGAGAVGHGAARVLDEQDDRPVGDRLVRRGAATRSSSSCATTRASGARPIGMPAVAALADAVVHGLDVRRPLGLPGQVPAESLAPLADFTLGTPWPMNAVVGGSARRRVGRRTPGGDRHRLDATARDPRSQASAEALAPPPLRRAAPAGPSELRGSRRGRLGRWVSVTPARRGSPKTRDLSRPGGPPYAATPRPSRRP